MFFWFLIFLTWEFLFGKRWKKLVQIHKKKILKKFAKILRSQISKKKNIPNE
jgi:hypothetical protein